jgi:hypothetical protein
MHHEREQNDGGVRHGLRVKPKLCRRKPQQNPHTLGNQGAPRCINFSAAPVQRLSTAEPLSIGPEQAARWYCANGVPAIAAKKTRSPPCAPHFGRIGSAQRSLRPPAQKARSGRSSLFWLYPFARETTLSSFSMKYSGGLWNLLRQREGRCQMPPQGPQQTNQDPPKRPSRQSFGLKADVSSCGPTMMLSMFMARFPAGTTS